MRIWRPGPEARGWAEFGVILWEIALIVVLSAGLAHLAVPRQHLPWTPLRFDEPVGAATAFKLAKAEQDRAACLSLLRDNGVRFTRLPDSDDGDFCVLENVLRIDGGMTRLSPGQVTMTCPLAARLALWDRQVLQPAAEEAFGSRVSRIENFGTYACRRIYGRSEGRPSQHATANAFDFSGVRLQNGRHVTVAADWTGDEPDAGFLRRIRNGACDIFGVVLSPEYNAAHADHLHLDLSPFRLCR